MPIASVFRPVLLVLALCGAALFPPAVLGQVMGSTAADGFNPNVDGTVYAVVIQPDGKVLVAGNFTAIQPTGSSRPIPHANIVRLLPDGREDGTFNVNVNGQVSALILQPNGQIVIGGKFTSVAGVTRRRVARLNADGSLDATFDPNIEPRTADEGGSLTPEVTSLLLQSDGKLVVGGGFKAVQPNGAATFTLRNRLARFNSDGTLDAGFDPNANNMVLSLALEPDGQILVGGGFTTLQPNGAAATTARKRIARLNVDGTVDPTFDPQANNAVSAIQVLPGGNILIGGTFTGLTPNGVTLDASAGAMTRLARLNADGTLVTSFSGFADGPVSVITLQPDGAILVGGSFTAVGNGSSSYVGRLLPNGVLDTTFLPGPNYAVYAIAVQSNGSVLLGGAFLTLRGQGRTSVVRNHLARVSFRGALDTDFRPDVNGRVRSLIKLSNGQWLVGGTFTSIAGQTRNGVVLLNADGSIDPRFKADINGPVISAVQVSATQIIVGGSFTRINTVARPYLAKLNLADGSVDEAYSPAPNNQVNAMVLQGDGKLVIGGAFTTLSPFSTTEPVSRNCLARLNADGSVDLAFKAQANDAIVAMAAASDGQILIGGPFSTVVGSADTRATTRYGLARLNADGALDTGFNPNVNGTVAAIVVQSDNKIVFGGAFAVLAPNSDTTATTRNNLARVEADGSVDKTYDPNLNGQVSTLALQADGKVVAGGRFSALKPNGIADGYERNYVARINTDGTLDQDFNLYLDTTIGNEVMGLAIAADNKIVVAGTFAQAGVNAVPRSRVLRAEANGAIDTSFSADLSTIGGADIRAITQQFGGAVIVAGNFAGFGGTSGANLARFYADSTPDTSFVPSFNGPVYAMAESPAKGLPVATQRSGFAWFETNGALRSGFHFSSEVTSISSIRAVTVDSNGKILIAATFDLGGNSRSLVRFNPDGTIDSTFTPVTTTGTASSGTSTGTIYVIRPLADGKILIGGSFSAINTTSRNFLARLNADGQLDTSFVVSPDNEVYSLLMQSDGKLVVGGNFSSITASGASTAAGRNGIARLNVDGTLDTGFYPNPNGQVQVILPVADGKLLIAGGFSGLYPNGTTTVVDRSFVARLNSDGSVDTTLDLDANSFVSAGVLQPDGKIVLGGYFTTMGGTTRNYVARLKADQTLDDTFNPNPNGIVSTVALQPADNKIVLGGTFTALQPGGTTYNASLATPRNRLARLNSDGTVDPLFNPNVDGQVTALAVYTDGSLIATGALTNVQPSGSLMVGGAFTQINGTPANNFANMSSDGSISTAFLPNPNGAVNALLTIADGRTVVAGAFTQIAGATRNRVARFNTDDSLDANFNPNVNGEVLALALEPDGDLLIGGDFTQVGGVARNKLARVKADGSLDASFAPTVPGAVSGLAVDASGRIVVLAAGSGVRSVLLRLTADGAADPSFTTVSSATAINSFALQTDGRIVVGGAFTSIAGETRNYVARLNANGTIDPTLTSNPNGEVTAVLLQRDGKVVIGGRFNQVDGLARAGLARIATTSSNTGAVAFTTNAARNAVTWVRSGVAPEISSAYLETSADLATWTTLGQATRVPNSTNWQVTGVTLPTDPTTPVYVRASAIVGSNPQSSTGLIEAQGRLSAALPSITSAGVVAAAAGSNFLYAVTATESPTTYVASGLPPGLAINSATGLITGTPTQTGTYNVVVGATNAAGTGTATITVVVADGTTQTSRVTNLSVNTRIVASNTVVITGFVISGTGAQTVVLRAVGPGLTSLGVNGVLATPQLQLFNSNGQTLLTNGRWGGASQLTTEFARLGAYPLNADSEDAAVIVTLTPGVYTMHVGGENGATGTVLAEVYDASATPPPANQPKLVNISARGVALAGQPITGGFVIAGQTSRQVLIRGVGPGLTAQQVPDVLANPKLTLYRIQSGNATVIARNDDWQTPETAVQDYPGSTGAAISAAATTTGAFALNSGSKDAAILVTLPPGVYTAEVNGADGGIGAAIVEVYELP
ncbi:putative Ig domain-containing protein [Opitutus terrae]|uniref:Ig family protein n=1 Tax=Opitutus terrae (strain DSM 11246 / JCM 15787 / PB90-1) TaxID=452637 RepID=B1ZNK8_OPITP|nr:putative Ig domain-containing protein [Opitutus terrae]ACB74442.1 Ig family protein [Opitutus terrae PB90-1]